MYAQIHIDGEREKLCASPPAIRFECDCIRIGCDRWASSGLSCFRTRKQTLQWGIKQTKTKSFPTSTYGYDQCHHRSKNIMFDVGRGHSLLFQFPAELSNSINRVKIGTDPWWPVWVDRQSFRKTVESVFYGMWRFDRMAVVRKWGGKHRRRYKQNKSFQSK